MSHQWQSEWTAPVLLTAKKHLPELEKAKDLDRFFPGYAKKDADGRAEMWLCLVKALVLYESNYNPKCYFKEPAPLNYESVGLLQLSYEDTAYKKLIVLNRDKKTLEDPINNLCGGLRILAFLINRDGAITTSKNKGGAAYWSTLREKRGLPKVLATLKKFLAEEKL